MYANLLGLYALTQSHYLWQLDNDESKVNSSEFAELKGIIRPFLGNPLISNLYSLVIQSHEKVHAVSLAAEYRRDCLNWEVFFTPKRRNLGLKHRVLVRVGKRMAIEEVKAEEEESSLIEEDVETSSKPR
ncbi:uncharacterized protein A4U43_C03F660 [Asparagus officinalis]|uniref:Uncharacterized protein n=1 Tax=Asparagus officinalis TaxID=4686 RepID=A0A5P1F827_ASPOF|nr:uncharacterized protein A4U43_C03F660 [Asparagus officinalis]